VMELCNYSLADFINYKNLPKGELKTLSLEDSPTLEQAWTEWQLRVIKEVASGLNYLHEV
jgi:hypothetical protein